MSGDQGIAGKIEELKDKAAAIGEKLIAEGKEAVAVAESKVAAVKKAAAKKVGAAKKAVEAKAAEVTNTAVKKEVADGLLLVPGVNAHPDADGVNDDAEIADLGLAIPAALVDLVSIEAAAAANPGGVSSALNRVRLAYVGPVASEDVLKAILGPRHWSLCPRGNRYGVFAWTDA